MTLQKQLAKEYDRVIADTLARLGKTKSLTKQKLAKALFEANKTYRTTRTALIDSTVTREAESLARTLASPYAHAAGTFADRVKSIYAGYSSAFSLTKKDAAKLLDEVVYDRDIADSLRKIAEAMPDGEEKTRILAEISAPAYRHRLQRAEQLAEQAEEVCARTARSETNAVRSLLQTQTERAYNITFDEALGKSPSQAVLDGLAGEPIQLRFGEMPKSESSRQDFTPTTGTGIHDSFSLINTKAVRQITEHDWAGKSFSERIWGNTGELAKEVKQVLLEGELTGASEADMAAKISERFEVGMYKARRVVRTESNYCVNQAELKGMKDAGFDEYEFMSLHEERDCETCDDLDGEVFRIADAVVGVNMPPIHPFCRCKVTTPQETLEDIQADIDRMLDGRSIDDIERELDRLIEEREAEENEREMLTGGENSGIIGVETTSGVTITELSDHVKQRIAERELTEEGMVDAVKHPLHFRDTVYDELGRPSQRFIGKSVTVNVNPDTGVIPTAWVTGSDKLKKYGGGDFDE